MVKPKPEPQGINWRKKYTRSTAEMISTSFGGNPFTSKRPFGGVSKPSIARACFAYASPLSAPQDAACFALKGNSESKTAALNPAP